MGDTSNDESIARAIATADQEAFDAHHQELASRSQQEVMRNNNNHNSVLYPGQRYHNTSNNSDFIVPIPPRGTIVGMDNNPGGGASASIPDATLPLPSLSFSRMVPRLRVPMCHVPCIVGGDHKSVCVEMMVDTGAESSVISLQLARELGLEAQIDHSQRGVAAGVGRARILGRIHNVICTMGHVEFPMEFIVLDLPNNRMLLLGMDQLRKYNCIIDLQRDVLIFGGSGGVEVPLLPPEHQPNFDSDVRLTDACTLS